MKFLKTVLLLMTLVVICCCVSLDDRLMSSSEVAEYKIIGEVSDSFTSFHFLHFYSKKIIKNISYKRLLKIAKDEYASKYGEDRIDIRDIKIKGTMGPMTSWAKNKTYYILNIFNILYHDQTIHISSDVVIKKEYLEDNVTVALRGIDGVVHKSVKQFVEKIPEGATVAILNIFSSEKLYSEAIINELEFNLVDMRKFKIADRRRLNEIRMEKNFQVSGEVSDDSAVSIGNMLGANVVITGEFSEITKRIIIKVLDVETGQILAMTRESL